jgi:WD40 repeat protein
MPGSNPPIGSLFTLAAEAIAPLVTGCARTLRPAGGKPTLTAGLALGAGPALGAGLPTPPPPPKAIDLFGPPIVKAWRTALERRTAMDQQEAVKELAALPVAAAREQATGTLARLVPDAVADDRALAVEYLVAVPRSAQRVLIPEIGTTAWRLPPLLLPLGERTLLGLLPFHAPPLPVGAELSGTPYRLDEVLGTSRSGVLYRAINPGEYGAGWVAIKVCLDPVRAAALRDRRDLCERLRGLGGKNWSPRLVRLQAQGVEAPLPFVAYDFGPGVDLTSYLAAERVSLERGLEPGRVFDLIRQLATGLAVLHGRGFVHGDVKPANVLVSDGKVQLTDVSFGDAVRATLAVAGSPAQPAESVQETFAPAAQASLFHGSFSELYRTADPAWLGKPDPRADVYAVGVLWYQLLLGDFALQLDAGAVGGLIDPPFNLPRGQVNLIRQCVGDFADRPATARELLNLMRPTVTALLKLLQTAPEVTPARPAAGMQRLEQRLARKPAAVENNPTPAPDLGISLGMLGALAASSAAPASSTVPAAPDPRKVQAELQRLRDTLADQIERDALHEARVTAEMLLRLAPRDQDALDTIAFLDEQLRAIPGNPMEEVRVLAGHRDWVNSVVFAPDGRRLLSGAGGTLTGGEWGESDDRSMRLWDVDTGRETKVYAGHSSSVTCVVFTPDGRRFLSGSRGGTIALWDVDTGRPLRKFDRRMKLVWAVAISPDGRYALSGSDDKSVRLWNAETGVRLRRLEGHTKGVAAVTFSPDGRRALSSGYDGTVRLWDVANAQLMATFEGQMQAVLSVAFTPDGKQAVSAGLDSFVRLWDLGGGKEVRQFVGHTAQVNSVAVSPDGRWIVSGGADNVVRVWDLRTGREQVRSVAHTNAVTCVACSPDGQHAASASRDTTVRLYKLPR